MAKLTLMERIERLPRDVEGEHVPPPELVAFSVIMSRRSRNWKQSTLADFAGVSTSTVERIERGERVRDAQLDKVGVALGHEPGHFTLPRRQSSVDEAIASVTKDWSPLLPVEVSRITTQPRVRTLVSCHALLIHPLGCEDIEEDVRGLSEWFDLGSYLFSKILPPDPKELAGRRREFYRDVLNAIGAIERKGFTVLGGQVKDKVMGKWDWNITLVSITPKLSDPAAGKRRQMFIDRRNWGFEVSDEGVAV